MDGSNLRIRGNQEASKGVAAEGGGEGRRLTPYVVSDKTAIYDKISVSGNPKMSAGDEAVISEGD